MIYFVVAQDSEGGHWILFGPWERVEGADTKIDDLVCSERYSQVEIARVLTEEDGPDWEKK